MTTRFDPGAPVVVAPPAIVRNDTSRAEKVIEEVINLDRSMATNAFEMGDLFAEIVDGDYVHADHCQSVPEFLKKHNFELSETEIRCRVKVSKVSKRLGITREQQMKAKISKMKAICELNPELSVTNPVTGNTEQMGDIMRGLVIDAGAGKPLKDITKLVKELKGKTEGEDSLLEWLNLPTFKSRKEFINETLEMAVNLSGDTVDPTNKQAVDISLATALERVCAEARSGFGLEADAGEKGTFQDELYVRDEDGNELETGYGI